MKCYPMVNRVTLTMRRSLPFFPDAVVKNSIVGQKPKNPQLRECRIWEGYPALLFQESREEEQEIGEEEEVILCRCVSVAMVAGGQRQSTPPARKDPLSPSSAALLA
jgi:hypothetical protein